MMNRFLKWQIDRHMTVCFDIFDTLIERTVDNPSDIFLLAGKKVLGDGDVTRFALARSLAEKNARSKSLTGEVSLNDIYEQLPCAYQDKKIDLKNAELQAEIENCIAKKSMQDIYYYALKKNKKIYLISDMYLSSEVIVKILSQCRITGFEKLYVSNECGCNKVTGELFKHVMARNALDRSRTLHIGDSIKADFIGAYKSGITPFLITRKGRIDRYIHSMKMKFNLE